MLCTYRTRPNQIRATLDAHHPKVTMKTDRAYEAWANSEHEDSALLRAGRDAWIEAWDAWEDRCAAIDMAEHRLTKCPLCRHPILWNSDIHVGE